MRIAICFSGQVRTAIESEPNIKKFIGELYPYCDFFVHTWDTNTTKSYQKSTPSVLNQIKVEENIFADIIQLYNPRKIIIENYSNCAEKKPFAWVPRFYSWSRSVSYKKEYEQLNNFKYDYVVKLRFDVVYSENINLSKLIPNIKPNFFGAESTWLSSGYYTIDDCIWISDTKTMDIASDWNTYFYFNDTRYSGIYNRDPGWQVYFTKYLILNGIYPYNMYLSENKNWAVLRSEAIGYNCITDFNKIREIDRLLFWEDITPEYLTKKDLIKLNEIMLETKNYTSGHIINLIEKMI